MRRVSEVDYEVQTPGRRREKKVYHVNLLKKWQKLETVEVFTALDDSQEEHNVESCERKNLEEFLRHAEESSGDEDGIKVDINPKLDAQQRFALEELLHDFRGLPRGANLAERKLSSSQLKLEMQPRSDKHLTAFPCPKDRR